MQQCEIKNYEKYCFVCAKLLTECEIVTVERGMETLINASIERADEFSGYLQKQKSVTIHKSCRKNYTRKTSIAADKKRQREEKEANKCTVSPCTKSRAGEQDFCFQRLCLFCGKETNEEFERRKSSELYPTISHVCSLQFKDSILEVARTRSDAIAEAVIERIEFEYDLIAAGAKYHRDCYISFMKPFTGARVSCPEDETTDLVSEEYETDKKEDQFIILKAAAAIIRNDIQSTVFDHTNYPPAGHMFEDLNNDIPESLTYFMEQVVWNDRRSNLHNSKLICINLCHSIMSVIRQRSVKKKNKQEEVMEGEESDE